MDKLSEYIPLLVILVISIISAVGKKKKQSEMQKTTLPGKTAGEVVAKMEPERTLTHSQQRVVEEKTKKQAFQKPAMKVEKEIPAFSAAPLLLEAEEETSSFSFEEEDATQAIIYAEIINKKEW
jgi:hypothetical protein